MGVLAWLGVPAAATVLAIGWVHWTNRPRGPVDAHESLAQYDKFRQAMSRPVAEPRSRRRKAS